MLAIDLPNADIKQDRRFCRLQFQSIIQRHRTQAIVAGNSLLAANNREASVRVFFPSNAAGNARAVCLRLLSVRI